jgi:hypothetical protein
MLVEGIAALLVNDAGVKAILGVSRNDGTNGVFPSIAVEAPTLPYIVYQQIDRNPVLSYQGMNRLGMPRFQISCYGNPYKTVKQLANAVKNVLNGFQGALSDVDQTYVNNIILNSEHDETESVFKATLYGVILDYEFIANG